MDGVMDVTVVILNFVLSENLQMKRYPMILRPGIIKSRSTCIVENYLAIVKTAIQQWITAGFDNTCNITLMLNDPGAMLFNAVFGIGKNIDKKNRIYYFNEIYSTKMEVHVGYYSLTGPWKITFWAIVWDKWSQLECVKKAFHGSLLKLSSFLITLLRKSISTMLNASTMRHKKLFYRTPVGATTTPLKRCPKKWFSTGLFINLKVFQFTK
jgi:hypothetical protein